MRLTDLSIRRLAPPEKGQRTYLCDSLPGFGCRVSQGGSKTFVLIHGRDRRRITLGRFPVVSLAEAREAAKHILAERTLGKYRPKAMAWDDAVALFLADAGRRIKPRTLADYTRLFQRHFPFGRTQLTEITPDEMLRRLARLNRVPGEQNHALVVVRAFFRWALQGPRRYIELNPCDGMVVTPRPSRQRVLTDQEIIAVWNAADQPIAFHRIVRLCLLLGQRRGETGSLRAEFIDWNDHTVTLPDTKPGRPHTIPFGPMTAAILKSLPDQGYLFPGRWSEEAHYNGWAKSKRELDAHYAGKVAHYTLHDLRRTSATNWAKLGVPPHVVERLLNHSFGSLMNRTGQGVSAVAEVYNRHAYMDEMRDAISKWETRLAALLSS